MVQPANVIASILEGRDILFDPSPENNGIYLCLDPATAPGERDERLVSKLRAKGAWLGAVKQIGAEMKQAYAEQLVFEEAFAANLDGYQFLVLRAGNPKYPTRDESWATWRSCLNLPS